MPYGFMDIALTSSVREAQAEMQADHLWADFKGSRESDRLTETEVTFIEQRDSFYLASVSETGWPYVQHRGGPPGFLKIIDDRTLAFADFRGNRQYISTGNFRTNRRASLILVDYARRSRLKIYGHVEAISIDSDVALRERTIEPAYGAKTERIFRMRLAAFDWNCPQHITPRFTEREIIASVQSLQDSIVRLEHENADLRDRLGGRDDA